MVPPCSSPHLLFSFSKSLIFLDGDMWDQFSPKDQLSKELITLSKIPSSKWNALINIDQIALRNKLQRPEEPLKPAPFLLSTTLDLSSVCPFLSNSVLGFLFPSLRRGPSQSSFFLQRVESSTEGFWFGCIIASPANPGSSSCLSPSFLSVSFLCPRSIVPIS